MIDNKTIKARRVEELFISITKDMIMASGIKNTSVRKVADEACYTVATIYNHFGSFDALLAKTRDSIINDMAEYLADYSSKLSGVESIKSFYENYIKYCMDNPHIYYFLFSHHLKNTEKFASSEAMDKLTLQFIKSFEGITEITQEDASDITDIGNTIMFGVHGMLTIYLSDNFALSESDIYKGLNGIIKTALKGYNN